jgi:hypothetical protein
MIDDHSMRLLDETDELSGFDPDSVERAGDIITVRGHDTTTGDAETRQYAIDDYDDFRDEFHSGEHFTVAVPCVSVSRL